MKRNEKGFTLVELLLVLGVLLLILTIVVLIINPVEMLRQSRDARRISDASMLKTTLDLYLSQAGADAVLMPESSPGAGDGCSADMTGVNHQWRASVSGNGGQNKPFTQPYYNPANYLPMNAVPVHGVMPQIPGAYAARTLSNARAIDGSGWVSAPLNTMAGGSPIANLPIDPINQSGPLAVPTALIGTDKFQYGEEHYLNSQQNDVGYFYAFQCAGLDYEIDMNMESYKYGDLESSQNVEKSDGGTSGCYNGFCDFIDNNPLYNTTVYVHDINGGVFDDQIIYSSLANYVGNNVLCAGQPPGSTSGSDIGKWRCEYCFGGVDVHPHNGIADALENQSVKFVSCSIIPGLFSQTYLADNVYEVGNAPGLNL